MAVESVRIVLIPEGIRALLVEEGVQHDLMERAGRVAAAAQERAPMVDGTPGSEQMPIYQVDARSASRARALVVADHPAALAVEAKYRLLGGALDAARG